MENTILFTIFGFIYLFLLNNLLKKYNFCLDDTSGNEKHKLLLNFKNKTPLSGSLYFFPIIFYLFYEYYFLAAVFCLIFFGLGLLSDLKITNSPKLRLIFQFILLIVFLLLTNEITIDTRIEFINNLMNNEILKVVIISFFLLVIINGFNFIDGVNNLSSLNFAIILFFSYLLIINNQFFYPKNQILVLLILVLIFVVFNFFGKNFLGDGAVYGLSFFIGYLLINISLLDSKISPYYIANLLWYPAFENLFTIIRRTFFKRKYYLPDNLHLHQMLYKFLTKKILVKKNYLLSSLSGIIINTYLFLINIIGYFYYSETNVQITLIVISVIVYILSYNFLKNNH